MAGDCLHRALRRVVAAGMWISFSTEAVAAVEAMVGEMVQEEWSVGERPGPGSAGLLISRDACVRVEVDPMKETRVGQGENLKEGRLIMQEALWESRRDGLGTSNKPLALCTAEKAAG